ncbi:helix-turn-helix domain-containing protein [Clostridium perfringens]|nr:helix-turn-helix transcriptional regulator [Clostridium perfringens]HAT4071938.1 helix-turn-helix transcriptional regulator [Clostridium perfringens]
MEFGTLVKIKRKEKNLTLFELAKITEISPSYISRLENTQRTPVITIAFKLAKELDITIKEIQECFQINLIEKKDEKEKNSISDDDYITINNINNSLKNIANGKVDFVNGLADIIKDTAQLQKKCVNVIVNYNDYVEIIKIKFFDKKIIDFLERYFNFFDLDIMIIEGEIKKTFYYTNCSTFNLIEYLEVIESGEYEEDELKEIRKYLKNINY